MSAAPVLTILKNGETVKSCPIEGEAMLGRSEGCVIRLEDRAISRQHALFRRVGGQLQVEKKSEFAPLVVNGAECTKAVLKEGDVISIGPYLMKLSAASAAAATTPETAPVSPESPEAPAVASSSEVGPISVSDSPAMESSPSVEGIGDPVESSSEPSPDLGLGELALDTPMDGASPMMGDGGGVDLDGDTKVASQAKVEASLIFNVGDANVTEYRISKDEILIGRGKDCDIVLNDKKASRKGASIARKGARFILKDLGSSNGVYANDQKITEHELEGDDSIRIGDTVFHFKALQAGYQEQEKDFLPLPELQEDPAADIGDAGVPMALDMGGAAGGLPQVQNPAASLALEGAVDPAGAPIGSNDALAGIAGISGGASGKRATLLERFRAQPKPRQYLIIALVVIGGWFLMEDDEPIQKPKKPKTAQVVKGAVGPSGVEAASGAAGVPSGTGATPGFGALTAEKKKFIETQHELAFNHYKNKEYDKAIFEIQKIFALVSDYKDSREIERYAKEGKRKLEALAEEKRKREEEAALKKRIADLVGEAKEKMDAKKHHEALQLFSQILALDPENGSVAAWQKQLQDIEEDKRIAEQKKQVMQEVNRQAWLVFKQGMSLKKSGKYHSAIDVFGKVEDIGAGDPRPAKFARKQIKLCRAAIQGKFAPVFTEAKQNEEMGEHIKALALYEKALKIEPASAEAREGIARAKTVLNDRAKALYTEGVLAESYSDFALAKKKFKDCMVVAPKDNIYHQRAERKLSRYFKADGGVEGPQ